MDNADVGQVVVRVGGSRVLVGSWPEPGADQTRKLPETALVFFSEAQNSPEPVTRNLPPPVRPPSP